MSFEVKDKKTKDTLAQPVAHKESVSMIAVERDIRLIAVGREIRPWHPAGMNPAALPVSHVQTPGGGVRGYQ